MRMKKMKHSCVVQTPPGNYDKPLDIIRKVLDKENEKAKQVKQESKKDVFSSYTSPLIQAETYWYAETNGADLLEVLKLPDVDTYYTYSNEIMKIYELFGIEAARNLFILMFKKTLEDAGQYVDPRHLQMIAEIMFNQGRPLSIAFGGANRRNQTSFLSLMSIQQAMNVIKKAGFLGRKDPLSWTSAAIMVNRQVMMGTGGQFEILDDPEFNKQVEEMRIKQEKLSAADMEAVLQMLDNNPNQEPDSEAIENDLQAALLKGLMGHDDIEPDIQPQPKAKIVDKFTKDIQPIPNTIAPPMVMDPKLVEAHTKLRLPVVSEQATETITSTSKNNKVVRISTDKPKVAYYTNDSSIEETEGSESETESSPVVRAPSKLKKLAPISEEEKTTATTPKKKTTKSTPIKTGPANMDIDIDAFMKAMVE